MQQILARYVPQPNTLATKHTVFAEVISSDTDSPAFKPSNPIHEYTDQSLLRSDISSIYRKQLKTSTYKANRSKQKHSTSRDRKDRKAADKSLDKSKSKPATKKSRQSVNSSQQTSKKKNKLLASQIDKIGKIANAMVNPHMLTLGQHFSMSSVVSKDSLSLNGFQNQY